MIHVYGLDSHECPDPFDPYLQGRLLHRLFPHLSETAAEDMAGELPHGVAPRNGVNRWGESTTAGPAYSQLFEDSDDQQ